MILPSNDQEAARNALISLSCFSWLFNFIISLTAGKWREDVSLSYLPPANLLLACCYSFSAYFWCCLSPCEHTWTCFCWSAFPFVNLFALYHWFLRNKTLDRLGWMKLGFFSLQPLYQFESLRFYSEKMLVWFWHCLTAVATCISWVWRGIAKWPICFDPLTWTQAFTDWCHLLMKFQAWGVPIMEFISVSMNSLKSNVLLSKSPFQQSCCVPLYKCSHCARSLIYTVWITKHGIFTWGKLGIVFLFKALVRFAVTPPILMNYLEKRGVLARYPWVSAPLQVALCGLM